MGGVNQMWILKNSKDLLEYIQSWSFSSCNSIKTFELSTLYTSILRTLPSYSYSQARQKSCL